MKGRTALHTAHLHRRFSEDIDLDVYLIEPTKIFLEGYRIEGPWRTGETLRYHLKYEYGGRRI